MYVPRKIEFAGMLLKVSELWGQGDRVKSGVVVDSSRVSNTTATCSTLSFYYLYLLQIVFRCASSQMFLFLQVSSEMWDFDPNGDMYIDKAVDGFIRDLFIKWKVLIIIVINVIKPVYKTCY